MNRARNFPPSPSFAAMTVTLDPEALAAHGDTLRAIGVDAVAHTFAEVAASLSETSDA